MRKHNLRFDERTSNRKLLSSLKGLVIFRGRGCPSAKALGYYRSFPRAEHRLIAGSGASRSPSTSLGMTELFDDIYLHRLLELVVDIELDAILPFRPAIGWPGQGETSAG